MRHIRLDQDIRSVTDFRAQAAAVIDGVRESKRPVVLTQHGRGAAVLIDVEEYQKMVDLIETMTSTRAPRPFETPGTAALTPERDPVEAYKDGVDRSLLRENLARPVGERLVRLGDMARFAHSLRAAGRKARGE
jgi:prevent-host-death family protein